MKVTTLGRRAVTLPAEYKDVDMSKLDTKIVGESVHALAVTLWLIPPVHA